MTRQRQRRRPAGIMFGGYYFASELAVEADDRVYIADGPDVVKIGFTSNADAGVAGRLHEHHITARDRFDTTLTRYGVTNWNFADENQIHWAEDLDQARVGPRGSEWYHTAVLADRWGDDTPAVWLDRYIRGLRDCLPTQNDLWSIPA